MRIYRSEALIKENASIHIFSSKEDSVPLHIHDFIEIIYVTQGIGDETVNGITHRVRRGDLLFINYGSTHEFRNVDGFAFINICFRPEVMSESVITPENAFAVLQLTAFEEIRRESDEDGMVSFVGEERDEVERLLRAMQREYTEEKHSWRTVIKSYMNVLIAFILRKLVAEDAPEEQDAMWKEISDYIDSNLESDLTLSSLAGKCFYNPSYFSRAFKRRFDMPLSEYLNRKKIERAMTLCDRKLSDDEIARAVGFSYKSSFYRVFQRITGMTFSQYKKKYQSKE